jgi:hypothetical protein
VTLQSPAFHPVQEIDQETRGEERRGEERRGDERPGRADAHESPGKYAGTID